MKNSFMWLITACLFYWVYFFFTPIVFNTPINYYFLFLISPIYIFVVGYGIIELEKESLQENEKE